MVIYLLLIVHVFFMYALIKLVSGSYQNKKRFFVISSAIPFVLMIALRHKSVGADTVRYWADYERGRGADFLEIFTDYGDNKAYYWISEIFSDNNIPIQIWFGFIGLLYIGVSFYIIYKYSEDPLISVVMFTIVGGFGFAMAGLKQTLAMVFTLLAFIQLQNKRPIRFFIFVALGSLFHLTALVMLLAFPLSYIKSTKIQVPLYSVLTFLAFFNAIPILERVLSLLDNDHYASYLLSEKQYTLTDFFVQLLILLVSLFYKSKLEKENNLSPLFTMVFLGVMFQAYASEIAHLFRLSLYFKPFGMILLPNALNKEENPKIRTLLRLGVIIVFVAYLLYQQSNGTYKFYWQ